MNDLTELVDEGPQTVDISNSQQSWEDVAPDLWFSASHFKGKEVVLTIKAVKQEITADPVPRTYLEFDECVSRLGLNRECKMVLAGLFGAKPADWVRHKITITAGANWMRQLVFKILPRLCDGADDKPQLALDPPPPVQQQPAAKRVRKPRKKSSP